MLITDRQLQNIIREEYDAVIEREGLKLLKEICSPAFYKQILSEVEDDEEELERYSKRKDGSFEKDPDGDYVEVSRGQYKKISKKPIQPWGRSGGSTQRSGGAGQRGVGGAGWYSRQALLKRQEKEPDQEEEEGFICGKLKNICGGGGGSEEEKGIIGQGKELIKDKVEEELGNKIDYVISKVATYLAVPTGGASILVELVIQAIQELSPCELIVYLCDGTLCDYLVKDVLSDAVSDMVQGHLGGAGVGPTGFVRQKVVGYAADEVVGGILDAVGGLLCTIIDKLIPDDLFPDLPDLSGLPGFGGEEREPSQGKEGVERLMKGKGETVTGGGITKSLEQ